MASDDLYTRDPHAILETFLLYQTTVGLKDLSARTLRALYNARGVMDSAFRRDPVNRDAFMRILQQPSGITHAMRLMNQTSVLGRYLWPFRRIVGQMQHDLFHVYTVDQHILMVLRNVRRFLMAEHAHEYPFCSQLAGGWDKPWILYVAALFHDIGKGRGGDHSQIGAEEVRRFCRQHGVDREDARLIEFLVREHLTMSTVAQKQDLSDPDVIGAFAHRVGNERNLTAMYLLTVADIRGTSPKVWNAWKGKLLEDLYHATRACIEGRHGDDTLARQAEARVNLALYGLPANAADALWQHLDARYFVRYDARDLAWQARMLWHRADTTGPVVRARLSPAGEGIQVLVYAPDRADIFARICGFFARIQYTILEAKIHTTQHGYALDSFQVMDLANRGIHYRDFLAFVEHELARDLDPAQPVQPPPRGRLSRHQRHHPYPTSVRIETDTTGGAMLTITCADRGGLLFAVAETLMQHELGVYAAKIDTLGERVEDTFLIRGSRLETAAGRTALETDLRAALA